MLHRNIFQEFAQSKAYFGILTDRGDLTGDLLCQDNTLQLQHQDCTVACVWEQDDNGVIHRKDTFRNDSDISVTVRSLKSRFVFEGGEYEVYTQFNNWLTESRGQWQELNTGVTCSCASVRTAQDAIPMLVLWNKQENRGAVFHLMPNCAWELKATRIGSGGWCSKILVELGIRDQVLAMEVAAGETIVLPEILCWETQNKLDFDSWKLHNWLHVRYPRKRVPFVYNSWLFNFTRFSLQTLKQQADLAAEMGLEYFVVDAGWFKAGAAWYDTVGDWVETTETGMLGQMDKLADYVRSLGMKFGLWLEPERAGQDSRIIHSHPEQFYPYNGNRFLNFADETACKRITEKICEVIDRYGIEYIKFDFNADLYHDPTGSAFYRWHQGHMGFLTTLKERYPDLHLSCCAGGGQRNELMCYRLYDSFWTTDDVGPYAQMDIFSHAILTMAPQAMEKWGAIHSLEKYADHYDVFNGEYGDTERILAGAGGAWADLVSIRPSLLQAFCTASPMGLSCNLADLSEVMRQRLKAMIAAAKADDDFRRTAVVRKLADTPTLTAYQFSDIGLQKIVLQVLVRQSGQQTVRLYPVLDAARSYTVNDTVRSGKELMETGICLPTTTWNNVTQLNLTAI